MFDVDRAVCGHITLCPTLVPVFAPALPPIVLEASLCSLTKLDAPGNPKTDRVTEHTQGNVSGIHLAALGRKVVPLLFKSSDDLGFLPVLGISWGTFYLS